MTKKEFCVALAKDVIKQVKRKKLIVTSGVYCQALGNSDYGYKQLDALIARENSVCEVCALGSLVASYAIAKDDTTVSEAGTRWSIVDRLGPYFGAKQLDLIEATFERTITVDEFDGKYHDEMGEDDKPRNPQKVLKAAYKFANRYPDEEARLFAIMRNIIKNEGRFVPKGA